MLGDKGSVLIGPKRRHAQVTLRVGASGQRCNDAPFCSDFGIRYHVLLCSNTEEAVCAYVERISCILALARAQNTSDKTDS